MPAPTIIASGLTKSYGDVVAVDHLDLEIHAGEVFGLLGPNGAGKTTTILMLLGLSEPTAGTVRVLDMDPTRNPLSVKRRVGYLPDSVGFYDWMTGRENLRFTASLNKLESPTLTDEIDAVLEKVGLSEAGDLEVGAYSRGMRQRLGIADALLKRPSVLILDEPTAAIDPEGVKEILGIIREQADEFGVTVLLSSHLLQQVQSVCDRVAIFVAGRVIAEGSPHELARGLEGPERVEITFEGDGSPAAVLESAAFVTKFEERRLPGSFLVELERGSTGRLLRTVLDEGLDVANVHVVTEDLDSVYSSYFKEARRAEA